MTREGRRGEREKEEEREKKRERVTEGMKGRKKSSEGADPINR